MAFKISIHQLTAAQEQEVEHNLKTLTPLASVWQNDFLVNGASIKALDEDSLVVYNVQSDCTLVLAADVKTSRRSKDSGAGD